jgi:hypothetical protein
MVRFGKSNCPIPLAPTVVRGTVGSDEGILPQVKWHPTRKDNKIYDNLRSCGGG